MPLPLAPAPGGFARARGPRRDVVVDAVLGLAIAVGGLLTVLAASTMPQRGFGRGEGPSGPYGRWAGRGIDLDDVTLSPWLVPALVLVAVGVALRRVWPRSAFVLTVAGVGLYLAVGTPFGPVLIAPALVVFVLGTRCPIRSWAPLMVLLLPMVWAAYLTQPYLGLLDPALYAGLLSMLAVTVMPALFALIRRSRRHDDERQREADLRRSAYEERLRIAREVHDVVGHSLSVVAMQAGVALHVLDKQRAQPTGDATPAEVTASLEAIRRTSREALAELRTTLEVFRGNEDQPRAPQPGLARLDDLVEALRQAGRTITVVRDPGPEPLPAAVDQAAFRIIQEGLTNVVRHAGDAAATVTVRQEPTRLSLEVADLGPVRAAAVAEGNGLRGMRERALAVGGTVALTARPGGGMVLRAELPLEPVVVG